MLALVLLLVIALVASWFVIQQRKHQPVTPDGIPAYSGQPYVALNENIPSFKESDKTTVSYEYYSPLDYLGRCGYAMACIGIDLMPTEDRESIGQVTPTGWIQARYDCVDGGNLYNRCHLIGFQLTGENANERNLITGTRYMNVDGMLPFENKVDDYIDDTGNHVLYRVTPVFEGEELVARGVQIEALSMEDGGRGISFHVFVYNVQPGVTIDYLTGNSYLTALGAPAPTEGSGTYILNKNSKKFHKETCQQGQDIKESNKELFYGSRDDLLQDGYTPGKCCNP